MCFTGSTFLAMKWVQRCRRRGDRWQETMFPLVFKNHLQGELIEGMHRDTSEVTESFSLFDSVHISHLCLCFLALAASSVFGATSELVSTFIN